MTIFILTYTIHWKAQRFSSGDTHDVAGLSQYI